MANVITDWLEYSNGDLFNSGFLIRNLYSEDLIQKAPSLQHFYEVFETVKNEQGYRYAFRGVIVAKPNETIDDITELLFEKANEACCNVVVYGNKTPTCNEDFILTDRNLNNWLKELNYTAAVIDEKSYAQKIFKNTSYKNYHIIYNSSNDTTIARFDLECDRQTKIEIADKASEVLSIYKSRHGTNAYSFLMACNTFTPSVDFYMDDSNNINVGFFLKVIDNKDKLIVNNYLSIDKYEASLLHEKADAYLQRFNTSLESLLNKSVNRVEVHQSEPNHLAIYNEEPAPNNMYVEAEGIKGIPLSVKNDKYIVYYEDSHKNKLYYTSTNSPTKFAQLTANGFNTVRNPLKMAKDKVNQLESVRKDKIKEYVERT